MGAKISLSFSMPSFFSPDSFKPYMVKVQTEHNEIMENSPYNSLILHTLSLVSVELTQPMEYSVI